MLKLVLIRHGQSIWNKENRFTGWANIPLSERGMKEIIEAGQTLKKEGFNCKMVFTSVEDRTIKSAWILLEEMDKMWIPVIKSWRLNEKHYGILQGMNKMEMAQKFGDEKVLMWRRSYSIAPPKLDENDNRHPKNDPRYSDLKPQEIPLTESLKDTINRIIPYWESQILRSLVKNKEIIVIAGGNSLRAIAKHLKKMDEDEILKFNVPTGIPYVFEFTDNMKLFKDYFIGDPEEIRKLMHQVANQARR
jgi:2,3-bisphosphoglycerate-dependent phosphoglycerate mutase